MGIWMTKASIVKESMVEAGMPMTFWLYPTR